MASCDNIFFSKFNKFDERTTFHKLRMIANNEKH